MHFFRSGRQVALLVPVLATVIGLGASAASAQSASIATDGVGVARISLLAGNVGVQRGDAADSLAAAVNAPILGGDYVTTGYASKAEIQFDGSTQLRLGHDAQVRFTHLDAANRTLQLAAGTVELSLLRDAAGSTEIDTPSISIKPQERGRYRVSVSADGQTLVTVRRGLAEIDIPQGAQNLQPGTTLVAQGAADDPVIQTIAAIRRDDFDAFNAERDRLYERALADASFVNTDIGGLDDLPSYGRWVTDGSYGHVWVPASVGADWAPYRDGRWIWEDGYGWTWVAAEPWGWAPYHYGSWYHSPNYGWCWYPPQPHIYTPWRPALVAFFGFGAPALDFGVGAGFGTIGWVPLAPYEPYHPWWGNRYGYGANPTLVNNTTVINNITNITNVNVYRNVRYNGVSSVSSQRFLQGNFTHTSPVAAAQLTHAHVFRSALPVVPTASNLRFSPAEHAAVAVQPAFDRQTFAGNAHVVRRMSFADQRVALANLTHAPMTPLDAHDVRTPLVPQRAVAAPSVTAAKAAATPARDAFAPHPRALLDVRQSAAPVITRPTHDAPAAGPWARFNGSRPPGALHAVGGDRVRPVTAPGRNGNDAPVRTAPHAASVIPSYGEATTTIETTHAPAAARIDRHRLPSMNERSFAPPPRPARASADETMTMHRAIAPAEQHATQTHPVPPQRTTIEMHPVTPERPPNHPRF